MSDAPQTQPPTAPQSGDGAAPVTAYVTMARPPFWRDLGRMTAKILVGGLVIAVVGAIASAAISGGVVGGVTGATKAGGSGDDSEVISGEETSATSILVVPVDGIILTHAPRDSSGGFFGFSGVVFGYEVKRQLEDAAESDEIDAVLMQVSTPGGSIAGSHAIHEGVQAVKEAGKPIAVYVDGVSASGGVWSTAAADAIFADHGAVVGSVGVLGASLLEYDDPVALGGVFSGVETRGGIRLNTTTAGRGKDLGNPFRPSTDEERARLQDIVDAMYDEFVAHLAAERDIDADLIVDELGAHLYSNARAQEVGLIDDTKTFDESAAWLGEELGVGDDYRTIAPPRDEPGLFDLIAEAASNLVGEPKVIAGQARVCAQLQGEVVAMALVHRANLCGW